MPKYQYELTCDLKINLESFITVADTLNISLPCINCQRDHRTIIFEGVNKKGICTSREKFSGFPGSLINREIIKESDGIKINYLIEFDYQLFIDLKYKRESNFGSGWARVHFSTRCSQCQREEAISTQENIVRPWTDKCKCGNIIYKEEKSPFKYEVIEIK